MAEAITSPTGATGSGDTVVAAPVGAAAPGGAAAAPPAVWTDSFTDPTIRDWAVNKGYNKYSQAEAAPLMAQQYHNLEKLFGADRAGKTIEIPDFEKADEASMNSFYDRLGRPKEGKDYNLEIPVEGKVDKEFSEGMAGLLHKAGISGRQATTIAKGYQEFSAARDAANLATEQQRFANEDKALKTEWGAAYENKMSVASAAAKSLGVPAEALDALQKVAGYGTVMKTFANIAAKLGEDNFISGEGAGGENAKMTPAEASAELKRFLGDKDVVAALMNKAHPKRAEYLARKAYLTSQEVGGA